MCLPSFAIYFYYPDQRAMRVLNVTFLVWWTITHVETIHNWADTIQVEHPQPFRSGLDCAVLSAQRKCVRMELGSCRWGCQEIAVVCTSFQKTSCIFSKTKTCYVEVQLKRSWSSTTRPVHKRNGTHQTTSRAWVENLVQSVHVLTESDLSTQPV